MTARGSLPILLAALALTAGATLARTRSAGATATTGPCEVGAELRGFPLVGPTRLAGYTSYLCPDGATGFEVHYQLFGKQGRRKTPLGAPQRTTAPDLGPDQPGAALAAFVIAINPHWAFPQYTLRTVTTYTVAGLSYAQLVWSEPGSLGR
jgi:hypothetical protein